MHRDQSSSPFCSITLLKKKKRKVNKKMCSARYRKNKSPTRSSLEKRKPPLRVYIRSLKPRIIIAFRSLNSGPPRRTALASTRLLIKYRITPIVSPLVIPSDACAALSSPLCCIHTSRYRAITSSINEISHVTITGRFVRGKTMRGARELPMFLTLVKRRGAEERGDPADQAEN